MDKKAKIDSLKAKLFDITKVKANMELRNTELIKEAKELMKDAKELEAMEKQTRTALTLEVGEGEEGMNLDIQSEGAENIKVDDKTVKGNEGNEGEDTNPFAQETQDIDTEVGNIDKDMEKLEAKKKALNRRKALLSKIK